MSQIVEKKPARGRPNHLETLRLRQKLRLPGFDYSQPGAYFITICARSREYLFGEIVDGQMVLNKIAQAVRTCWNAIPDHFPHVTLDAFVVMPNHVHGILLFTEPVGAGHARRLQVVIGSFKSAANRQAGSPIWQRSYRERILRNEDELNTARHYIDDSAFYWTKDKEYLT
jgi:REP element-mobilizing transposase RayT